MSLADAIAHAKAGRTCRIRCPAHEDHNPSLSVWPGSDGTVGIHCWAKCTRSSVLTAAGMERSGLLPDSLSTTARARTDRALDDKARKRSRWPMFTIPSPSELWAITEARGIPLDGLRLAVERGILWMATHRGRRCWVVTDPTRKNAQARRLDGNPFEGGSKALTLPGSIAAWPIGLGCIQPAHQAVLLVEGGPDLLAALQEIWQANRTPDAHAVAMMGATMRIPESSLHLFGGRRVRIIEHADPSGQEAGRAWASQLHPHAAAVLGTRLGDIETRDGKPVKDLNDALRVSHDTFHRNRCLRDLVP